MIFSETMSPWRLTLGTTQRPVTSSRVSAAARVQWRVRKIAAFARRPVRRCNGGTIDAENERNRIAVALLLDGAEAHPVWIVEIHETIVGVDDLTRVQAVCIGRNVRIDEFVHRIGKIHLSGEHVAIIKQHLEVNVRSAARVPARIDRLKANRAYAVCELRSSQEFLPDRRDILLVALALV